MRIRKCYFCSKSVYPGHGITFARNDAKLFHFCSSKCNKLFKAKKNPRKLKWTKAYRAAHGKEMTNDSVLEFEQRRNVPVRYNRDLMVKTLQAMKRVGEIKKARMERAFKKRMDAHKGVKKMNLEIELMKHVDLIDDPNVKAYIQKKKEQRKAEQDARLNKNSGIHGKKILASESEDEEMSEESEEPERVAQKAKATALAKISKTAKKISK